MTAALEDFVQLVRKNLEKNGFPEKSVSFPLEKMYESASERGFSFNKVRDELKQLEINSEIEGDRIIFAKQLNDTQAASEGFDMSNMAAMAQQMLAKMTPEQQAQIAQMMQNMTPEEMSRIKSQWENMPAEEKQRAMKDLK
jgi:glucan biosynthesis protein